MRLIVLTTVSIALLPSVAFAQTWQDWAKSNPTYGAPKIETIPIQPAAPASVKAAPATPTKAAPNSWTSTNKYPLELKRFFTAKCASGIYTEGDTVAQATQAKAFCGCVINKSEAAYSLQQFLQTMEYIGQTGDFPGKFEINIITPCLKAVGAA
jgi:hypothetical protein